MFAAKHFLGLKIESVGFIALSGCFKKVVFHMFYTLMSMNVDLIALPDLFD